MRAGGESSLQRRDIHISTLKRAEMQPNCCCASRRGWFLIFVEIVDIGFYRHKENILSCL
jgi:hypothetical protein